MRFENRQEAGKLLAKALEKYKGQDVIVYALPRGGVVTAVEIARALHAPLDLIIVRKIGHPYQPEYAIAAVAENGDIIGAQQELQKIESIWLQGEIALQRQEAKRRREIYLKGKSLLSAKGKIAILVDDGIATGLTMRIAVKELKHQHPATIIVAVPMAPQSTAELIGSEVDEFVSLDGRPDYEYLGAVGAYYNEFRQVEDEEVTSVIESYNKEHEQWKKQKS